MLCCKHAYAGARLFHAAASRMAMPASKMDISWLLRMAVSHLCLLLLFLAQVYAVYAAMDRDPRVKYKL